MNSNEMGAWIRIWILDLPHRIHTLNRMQAHRYRGWIRQLSTCRTSDGRASNWRIGTQLLCTAMLVSMFVSHAYADVPDTPHRPAPGAVPPIVEDLGSPPAGSDGFSGTPYLPPGSHSQPPAKPLPTNPVASRTFPAPSAPTAAPPVTRTHHRQQDLDREIAGHLQHGLIDVVDHVSKMSVTLISRSRGVGTSARQPITGAGSGVVVRYHGVHILTNAHVVDGDDTMTAIMYDGREYRLSVRATDKNLDVALLRFADGDPNFPWAANLSEYPSMRTAEGAWVIATGNPFLLSEEGKAAASIGVVSGFRRNAKPPHGRLIQHDAEINPGSSGGPLWNAKGKLVGLNGAILTRARVIGSGGPSFTGASVAIPVEEIRTFIERVTGNAPIRTRPVVHRRRMIANKTLLGSGVPMASGANLARPGTLPAPRVTTVPRAQGDIGSPPYLAQPHQRMPHGDASTAQQPLGAPIPAQPYRGIPVQDDTRPIGLNMEDYLNADGAHDGVVVRHIHGNSVFRMHPSYFELSPEDVIVSVTVTGQSHAIHSIAQLIQVLDLHGPTMIEAIQIRRYGALQYLMPRQ